MLEYIWEAVLFDLHTCRHCWCHFLHFGLMGWPFDCVGFWYWPLILWIVFIDPSCCVTYDGPVLIFSWLLLLFIPWPEGDRACVLTWLLWWWWWLLISDWWRVTFYFIGIGSDCCYSVTDILLMVAIVMTLLIDDVTKQLLWPSMYWKMLLVLWQVVTKLIQWAWPEAIIH